MKKTTLLLLFVSLFSIGFAKPKSDGIPPAPIPPRLVNDFAGVMTTAETTAMERRLVAFNDTTTNVICVVTVNDLGHYSAAQFAYEIGDRWGVRSKEKRNGVVILVKPSSGNGSGDGDVYISVGYDLEGAIPDAIAKRIIEQKMIPELKEGRYHAAIDSALTYIIPLALGEIDADALADEEIPLPVILLSILFVAVPLICLGIVASKHGGSNGGSSSSGGFGGGPVYWGPTPFGGFGRGGFGGGFSGGGFGGFGGGGGFGRGGAGGKF